MNSKIMKLSVTLNVVLMCCALPGAASSATVLWDQMAFTPGSVASTASNTGQNAWAADDFQLAATSDITRIAWVGGRSNNININPPVVDGFRIRFFDNVFDPILGYDRPADTPLYDYYITTFTQDGKTIEPEQFYTYRTDLTTPFTANANDIYWLSVQANADSDPNSTAWLWLDSNTSNLSVAEFSYPGNNYVQITQGYDLAFALEGSPVPVPGAVWLLGSGLLGLGGLRRGRRE